MMTLPFPLSEAALHALGWTLLHSLWQGGAIALVLLLLLTRLHSARLRYQAAFAGLLTMLCAAVLTFCWLYEPTRPASETAALADDAGPGASSFLENTLARPDLWERASSWIDARHPLIVGLWLLGFGFFLLRLVGGLWWIRQLRRMAEPLSDPAWAARLNGLARQLGQSKPVALFESAIVRVPLTIGWLKPVILLPVGLVNQLSVAEVEALLAHELAHIVRRDWLFNLLQAFIEALFYYHPAVWWLSATARREREISCDDTALSLTGNRLAYAKALVQVQEMARAQGKTPALALAAAGATPLLRRRPVLLERIQRILNQQHKKSQLMEKFIATALLAALVALWGAQTRQTVQLTEALSQIAAAPLAWIGGEPEDEPALVPVVENDSVPKGQKARQTQKIVQENDEGRVEMDVQDGQITRLNINGQDVPANQYTQHQDLTDELLRNLAPAPPPVTPGVLWYTPPAPPAAFSPLTETSPLAPLERISPFTPPTPPGLAEMPAFPHTITTTKDDQGNTVLHLISDGQPSEVVIKGDEVWVDGQKLEESQTFTLGTTRPQFPWSPSFAPQAFEFSPGLSEKEIERMQEEQARAMAESSKEMKQIQKQMERDQKELRKQQKKFDKQQRKEMERAHQELSIAERELERQQQMDAISVYPAPRPSENFSQAMRRELRNDGLLPDPNHYSLQLSAQELVVNGKKQPSALHRKYLELYRAKTGQELGPDGNINIVESRD
ncbi:MAG: M56 family metallopeptidase [Saprospiraceae bacterium]